jgi:hypothetical protein
VAQGVVYNLEVVEVHEQNSDLTLPPLGARERVLEAVHEQGPVRQAGQGVVEGLVLEALLERLALGDVAHRCDVHGKPPVGECPPPHLDVDWGTILLEPHHLVGFLVSREDVIPDPLAVCGRHEL